MDWKTALTVWTICLAGAEGSPQPGPKRRHPGNPDNCWKISIFFSGSVCWGDTEESGKASKKLPQANENRKEETNRGEKNLKAQQTEEDPETSQARIPCAMGLIATAMLGGLILATPIGIILRLLTRKNTTETGPVVPRPPTPYSSAVSLPISEATTFYSFNTEQTSGLHPSHTKAKIGALVAAAASVAVVGGTLTLGGVILWGVACWAVRPTMTSHTSHCMCTTSMYCTPFMKPPNTSSCAQQ